MIFIELKGGLGNQMFQYAFAYIISLKTGHEVKYIFRDTNRNTNRELSLQYFGIPLNEMTMIELFQYQPFHGKLKRIAPFWNEKYQYTDKSPESSLFKILNRFGNVYMRGYWNDKKYFVPYKNELFGLFKFNIARKYEDINWLSEIKKSKVSVSIHVRRGDYLNMTYDSGFKVLSISYYKKAINFFESNYKDVHYFIFSDDPKWSNEFFAKWNINYTLVSSDESSGSDWRDMALMSRCDHNIIANSTFSWWAAFLNSNCNAHIIAPINWKDNLDEENLILNSWIKL